MARLHPLQRHGHHRRQSLDDEHIVSAEAGVGLMMNDPNSAQRCAVMVVQRNDQRFADRRLNSHQIRKCLLWARQDNGCADVQTESAGAVVARRPVSLVSSQRATHYLPNDRPDTVTVEARQSGTPRGAAIDFSAGGVCNAGLRYIHSVFRAHIYV